MSDNPEWLDEALDSWKWEDHGFEDIPLPSVSMDLKQIMTGSSGQVKPENLIEFDPTQQENPVDYFDELIKAKQAEENKPSPPPEKKEIPQGSFPITNLPKVDEDVRGAILANPNSPDTITAALSVQIVRNQNKVIKQQDVTANLLLKLIGVVAEGKTAPVQETKPQPTFTFGE